MRVFKSWRMILLIAYFIGKKESKNYRAYEIKEESMSPSLLQGEYIFAKLAKENPKRGSVVIFENKGNKIVIQKPITGFDFHSDEIIYYYIWKIIIMKE